MCRCCFKRLPCNTLVNNNDANWYYIYIVTNKNSTRRRRISRLRDGAAAGTLGNDTKRDYHSSHQLQAGPVLACPASVRSTPSSALWATSSCSSHFNSNLQMPGTFSALGYSKLPWFPPFNELKSRTPVHVDEPTNPWIVPLQTRTPLDARTVSVLSQ